MKKFNTLIGLNVKVFIDSHVIEGVLENLDEEKIILNSNGSYILVFKRKINMVLLNPEVDEERVVADRQEPPPPVPYHVPRGPQAADPQLVARAEAMNQKAGHRELDKANEEESVEFAQNGIAERNQFGSILPSNLLEDEPKNIYSDRDEFSISASKLRNEELLLSRAERQKILKEERERAEDGSGE